MNSKNLTDEDVNAILYYRNEIRDELHSSNPVSDKISNIKRSIDEVKSHFADRKFISKYFIKFVRSDLYNIRNLNESTKAILRSIK